MTLPSIVVYMKKYLRKFKGAIINYFKWFRLKLIILLVDTNWNPERISFLIYDSLVTKRYGESIYKHTFIMQTSTLNNLLDAFDSAEPVSIDNNTNSKFLASKLSQEDFLKLNENNLS